MHEQHTETRLLSFSMKERLDVDERKDETVTLTDARYR